MEPESYHEAKTVKLENTVTAQGVPQLKLEPIFCVPSQSETGHTVNKSPQKSVRGSLSTKLTCTPLKALKQELKQPIKSKTTKRAPRKSVRGSLSTRPGCTPKKSLKLKQELEQSIHNTPLKQAAACNVDDDDDDYDDDDDDDDDDSDDDDKADAMQSDHYDHIWLNELPPLKFAKDSLSCKTEIKIESNVPGAVDVQAADPLQPGPSNLSGTPQSTTEMDVFTHSLKRKRPRKRPATMAAEGSENDSDFDDKFDDGELASTGGISRNTRNDDELDEPVRKIMNSVERALDEAIEQLTEVSTDFQWHEDFDTFRGVREPFSGPTPGPVKDYDTPYDAFTDIWNSDIIDLIIRETNKYAGQVIDQETRTGQLKPTSRNSRWSDTNRNEIYSLFAMYILMGLDDRIAQHEFWRKSSILEMPKFRQLMSYNRFILLSRFLHFTDNSDQNQNLPLSREILLSPKVRKIAPIIAHLNSRFQVLYNMHPGIVIDECLTLFNGPVSNNAIRLRVSRVGFKSYELCESSTGYLYKFDISSGKNSRSGNSDAPNGNLADRSLQIVMDLLKGLERRGHCVTMDRFYNCPALARHLKSLGFDCLGALRPNRKYVPYDMRDVAIDSPKGSLVALHSGDVTCMVWNDTKLYCLISTYHTSETCVHRKAGRQRNVEKPIAVRDYDDTMGGFDLNLQKLTKYLLDRKRCVKWYIKLFKRLLNISVHNAFVLLLGSLKRRKKPLLTPHEFRIQLANLLVTKHRPSPVDSDELSLPVTEGMRLRKDIVHVPEHLTRSTRKNCRICLRNGVEKKVHLKCVTCDESMCFGDCWLDWHSLKNLPGRDIQSRQRRRLE